jgi:hypothetical protein
MLSKPEDMAIVEAVIGLAASFRLLAVAEGVEQVDQILMLLSLGCNVMQGFALARPIPAGLIPGWLAEFAPDPLWSLSACPLTSRDYFELLLAEVNHPYWIAEVLDSLDSPHRQLEADHVLDYTQCRFGQWFYHHDASRFRQRHHMSLLDELHQEIHRVAAKLVQHHQDGKLAKAELNPDLNRGHLLKLQQQMTKLVHRLRSMLADDLLH